MTAATIEASGVGYYGWQNVVLNNGKGIAEVTDAITTVSMDYRVGSVAEMQVGLVDVDGSLVERGLLEAGTTLSWYGEIFEVAATDLDYRGEAIVVVHSARSRLARRLRNQTAPSTTKNRTPAEWITARVKKAGGTAVVQTGAKRQVITQKRGESTLDMVANLASDTGTEWTEFGGRLFCGTGWWALQGNTNLPTWPVSYGRGARTGVTQLSTRSSLDDRSEAASAAIEVPYSVGYRWRPWHRVDLTGASRNDNGIWLVQDVTFDMHDSATVVATLYRPLKSSPQNGSTREPGNDGLVGIDGWVPGADTVGINCTRTPREMVALAIKAKGPYVGTNWNQRCQAWVNYIAKGSIGGAANGIAEWAYKPPGTPHGTNYDAPAGAVVCFTNPHTAISVGGGEMIGTSGSGIVQTPIWRGTYLGWKYPNLKPSL